MATETRESLVQATRDVICERGVGGATARVITGRAGANLASIPYHFGSKDSLVTEALLAEARELIGPVLELLASDLPPGVRAARAIGVLNDLFDQRRDRVPVYLSAVATAPFDDEVRAGLQALWRDLRIEFAAQITELKVSGVIQQWVDPNAMSALILSLVNGVITASVIDPDGPGHPEVAAQLLQLLLFGVETVRIALWLLVIGLIAFGVVCTSIAIAMSVALARRGTPRSRWTSPIGWCRRLAAVSLVLVALAVGGLLFLPTGESSTTTYMTSSSGVTSIDGASSTPDDAQVTTSTESVTLIENEGGSVLFVLAFPVIVAGLGAAIRGRWEHPVRIVCGWVLLAGSIVAMMTIGLLFLPAAAVLTIAGALTPSSPTRGRHPADIAT